MTSPTPEPPILMKKPFLTRLRRSNRLGRRSRAARTLQVRAVQLLQLPPQLDERVIESELVETHEDALRRHRLITIHSGFRPGRMSGPHDHQRGRHVRQPLFHVARMPARIPNQLNSQAIRGAHEPKLRLTVRAQNCPIAAKPHRRRRSRIREHRRVRVSPQPLNRSRNRLLTDGLLDREGHDSRLLVRARRRPDMHPSDPHVRLGAGHPGYQTDTPSSGSRPQRHFEVRFGQDGQHFADLPVLDTSRYSRHVLRQPDRRRSFQREAILSPRDTLPRRVLPVRRNSVFRVGVQQL